MTDIITRNLRDVWLLTIPSSQEYKSDLIPKIVSYCEYCNTRCIHIHDLNSKNHDLKIVICNNSDTIKRDIEFILESNNITNYTIKIESIPLY